MGKTMENYQKKLNHSIDSDGRFLRYPSKMPLRMLVLTRITAQIDASRKYTEREINEIIESRIAFHDVALIRRELCDYGFLGRLRNGSAYWVESDWRNVYAAYIGED